MPIIREEQAAYTIVSLYFMGIGLVSIIRGSKYNRDESIFQVTVIGGFIYIVLASILLLLIKLGSLLVAVVLGMFVVISALSRGFFYEEVVNLPKIRWYNLLYVAMGLLLMTVPSERFALIKVFFGMINICVGIINYYVIAKRLMENSQEI